MNSLLIYKIVLFVLIYNKQFIMHDVSSLIYIKIRMVRLREDYTFGLDVESKSLKNQS